MTSTDSLQRPLAGELLEAAFVGSAETLERQQAILSQVCRTAGVFGSLTEQSLSALRRMPLDIVFLKPDQADGNDLWEELATVEAAIVLVADGPEYAVRAFQIGAVDYLVHPIGGPRLSLAIGRAACDVRAEACWC